MYPRLVVLAAHIPTLGLILYYIDYAKSLNPVSLMPDFPNDFFLQLTLEQKLCYDLQEPEKN